MRVEQLMTRNPVTCLADADAGHAAKLMWDGDFGCVPVVTAEGVVVGMITDRDVCMAALHEGRRLADIRVAMAMSQDPLTCLPDDDAVDAERRMAERQVRRLPVVDTRGRCVGVLSINDLANATASSALRDRPSEKEVARTLAAVGQHRRTTMPPSA